MASSMAAFSRPSLGGDLHHSPYTVTSTVKFYPAARRIVIQSRIIGIGSSFNAVKPKLLGGGTVVSFAAAWHEESQCIGVKAGHAKGTPELRADELEETWKQTLESFRHQALRLQALSQEAYDVYSKKAMVVLMETSQQLKIHGEKAKQDLAIVAMEISEEGTDYLSNLVENPPEEVKDIVVTFSSFNDLKHLSEVRDFYLGIPYGSLLFIGGFLSFMLTGSISAIRFGVILGGALLALSISSLRAWKQGQSSFLNIKGQAAIACIIFLRELQFLSHGLSLLSFIKTFLSGTMVIFYLYRIWLAGDLTARQKQEG